MDRSRMASVLFCPREVIPSAARNPYRHKRTRRSTDFLSLRSSQWRSYKTVLAISYRVFRYASRVLVVDFLLPPAAFACDFFERAPGDFRAMTSTADSDRCGPGGAGSDRGGIRVGSTGAGACAAGAGAAANDNSSFWFNLHR